MYIRAAVNVMLTQIQASRGFKLFGGRSVAAIVKYLKQLDNGSIMVKKVI